MQCYVLGPHSSGKTSLCLQLRSVLEDRSIIWPPERLEVAATSGQELYTISLAKGPLEVMSSGSSKRGGGADTSAHDSTSNIPASLGTTSNINSNSKSSDHDDSHIPYPHASKYTSAVDNIQASLAYTDQIIKRHEKLAKQELHAAAAVGQETLKEAGAAGGGGPPSTFTTINVIEAGGALCSAWPRFLAKGSFSRSDDATKKPSLLLYVIDINSPGQIPIATMELHNLIETYFPWLLVGDAEDGDGDNNVSGYESSILNVLGETGSGKREDHTQCRLAIVFNKVVSAGISGTSATEHSLFAAESEALVHHLSPQKQHGGGDGSVLAVGNYYASLKEKLSGQLMLPSNANIPVFLSDSWYGMGLGDVANWLAQWS